jgi:hypothetical protein
MEVIEPKPKTYTAYPKNILKLITRIQNKPSVKAKTQTVQINYIRDKETFQSCELFRKPKRTESKVLYSHFADLVE